MRSDAKSICIHGHDKEPGKDCKECSRLRALRYYHANRDKLLVKNKEYTRVLCERRKAERDANPLALCSKGLHERKAGIACQECRRDYFRAKMGDFCPEGHPRNGRACKECANARSREYQRAHVEKSRAAALASYYRRKELGLIKPSTEGTRAWRAENRERDRELRTVHQNRRRARMAGGGGSHTPEEWRAIREAHENKCAHCGVGGKLTKDHVEPIKLGGSDYVWNLQPLCGPCNSRKGAKLKEKNG